jgi:hypothetical protein
MPELLLMPRGLITILLFYGIPQQFKLNTFNNGILFFVILITSVLMMLGIMTAEKKGSSKVSMMKPSAKLYNFVCIRLYAVG